MKRSPPEIILEARALDKTYQMGEVLVHALRGADLQLWSGEMVVLLGPSGSGKSTLLNLLGGLDVPSHGSIRFRNQELSSAEPRQLTQYRREHIGFVFQFYNLIPSLTALENVKLVSDICPRSMAPRRALDMVGLSDRIDHFPSQLSGGEQQRVAIARAVVKQPLLLLCDEPTGALDCETGVKVLEAIDDVNQRLGTTTAIITHNTPIASMADRIVTMADGRIQSAVPNPLKRPPSEITW
ncbi:MAG: ABC transporter ATP-binding protein [Myxococcota bacterium]